MNINAVFKLILYLSILGSVMAGIIFLIKFAFKSRLNSIWQYYIWMLLVVRLIIPFNPPSVMSIYNLGRSINNSPANEIACKTGIDISSNLDMSTIVNSSVNNVPNYNEITDNTVKTEKVSKPLNAAEVISYVWFFGMISILVYMFIINFIFKKSIKKEQLCDDCKVNGILDYCRKKLNIKKKIMIFYSSSVNSPALTGIINPKILIPRTSLTELNDDEIRYIIMHELSHYKRKDILMNWVIVILQSVYWFNPFIVFSLHCMKKDSEMACDAAVMDKLNKDENFIYGNAIIHFAQIFSEKYYIPERASIISGSQIKRRISMISKFKKNSITMTIAAVIVIAIAGCAGLTGANASKKNKAADKQQNKIVSTNDSENAAPNSTQQSNSQQTSTDTKQNPVKINESAATAENPFDILSKMTGEWFEKGYIDGLVQIKSPYKAQKEYSTKNVILRISKNSDGYSIIRGFGFHQGMNEKVSNVTKISDDVYEIKFTTDSNTNGTATIKVYNNGNDINEIVFSDSYNENVKMVKEPNISNLVINGKFADENGKIYTFINNSKYWDGSGTAVWPDKTFKYKLNFDTAMSNCDCIYEVGSNGLTAQKYYVYEWQANRNTLLIYNAKLADNGEELIKDQSSVIRLHAVK